VDEALGRGHPAVVGTDVRPRRVRKFDTARGLGAIAGGDPGRAALTPRAPRGYVIAVHRHQGVVA